MGKRVILIVLDSCGVGALPDAALYGEADAHTLAHTWEACGGLCLPNLRRLGLGHIEGAGIPAALEMPIGVYGKCREVSVGMDTTTGHWEIGGVHLHTPFPTYPNGFPSLVIEAFKREAGVDGVLCNRPCSGTEVIQRLGARHMETGFPIVYTSADSVFQIAAHEETVGVERLYDWCRAARKVLQGQDGVARVIARPFAGNKKRFYRTENRKDFSLEPVGETVLDRLSQNGIPVWSVGKIEDIFCGRGIQKAMHTGNNTQGLAETEKALCEMEHGLLFVNLVDFDSAYGHRNDPQGYGMALEEADAGIGRIMAAMKDEDLLIVCADHGCDPTTPGTDHNREYVPCLIYNGKLPAQNAGIRETMSDIGATALAWLGLPPNCGRPIITAGGMDNE